jgi:plasmid stabilization system protein ParE
MPQSAWSPKRERQYQHIKESLEERGTGENKAEEIAARTVNKDRARAGEAQKASRTPGRVVGPTNSSATRRASAASRAGLG